MADSGTASRIELSDEGHVLLNGTLSFATVPALLRESQPLLSGDVTIDLQGVSRSDSAGLALLVEWQRCASNRETRITFLNMPPQMMALARLSGLVGVLSLSPGSLT